MNVEQAKEYAKHMTYSEAVANAKYSKGMRYRKATMIKLRELAEIADRLDNAPTIEPKQGEWIEMYRNGFGNMICMCSKCSFHASRSCYCPNCGARMKEADDEKPM